MVALLIVLCVLGLGFLIAFSRRGTVRSIPFGSRVETVHSPLPPEEAFERLVAAGGRFALEDSDPQMMAILLATNPTFATWGFFYPILITPGGGGGSAVQIGIKSRFIQIGPLVTKWHRQCAAHVEAIIGRGALPAAQVVSR